MTSGATEAQNNSDCHEIVLSHPAESQAISREIRALRGDIIIVPAGLTHRPGDPSVGTASWAASPQVFSSNIPDTGYEIDTVVSSGQGIVKQR
ncbi:hypothetical protein MACH17_21700 [Phaeobacter inhibens]|nr:hypothetical protein MACH17_21700 [Phaeobacter inhibens]